MFITGQQFTRTDQFGARRYTILEVRPTGIKVKVETGIIRNGKFRQAYGQRTSVWNPQHLNETLNGK
jgi:hypothetical protein